MELNLERGAINASNDILKNGFDSYFNEGVILGFFNENDNKKDILDGIIGVLKKFERDDMILRLLNNI